MEVTDANIASTVKDGIVLLDFWAEWCGPCRVLTPIISEVESDNPDITVGKVNVDTNPSAAQAYGVRGIPLLVYLKNGEVVETSVGVMSKADIQAKINKLK